MTRWLFAETFVVCRKSLSNGGILADRARKLNVDDLGECGGELRGVRGVGERRNSRQLPIGTSRRGLWHIEVGALNGGLHIWVASGYQAGRPCKQPCARSEDRRL